MRRAECVERRDGYGARGVLADERGQAHSHLLGRAHREREREHLLRLCPSTPEQVGDARRQCPGLARAGTGEHEQGADAVIDDLLLLGAQ